MPDLFAAPDTELAPGIHLFRAMADTAALLPLIRAVEAAAPFRHMTTPNGGRMAAAVTNCGTLGWTADARGYRYAAADPDSEQAWPPMPPAFTELAMLAAERAGFAGFRPDACLINRYVPGAAMGAHRDSDERDFSQPIVSVSLGLPIGFAFYGLSRGGKGLPVTLCDGDVLVFGGPARLRYHAVRRLKPGQHRLTGACRYNLTFRVAG